MQITWDEWAVPTITGKDDLDVVHGVGRAQAIAHAGTILELYGLARGTAAAMWGPAFLGEDTFTVEMGLRAAADEWFAAQGAETVARLVAFCEGFNAACAEDETRGSGRREVLPVTPHDVIAHIQRVFVRFNQLDAKQLAFDPSAFFGDLSMAGSNAWAVSAGRSSTGNAVLMINPHLSHRLPYHRFMEFRTTSPGRDFTGCTLVGVPWQSMGYSPTLGWAHTVNPIRNLSVHELSLDGDAYSWDGGTRHLEVREHQVEVLGAEPVTVVERRSVHGPVITAPDGTTVAVRMSGVLQHPATTALESWWLMSKATTVTELFAVHDRQWLPMFTIVAADSTGSIGALFCGTPWVRTQGDLDDSQRRLPGDDPAWLFDEVHPASAMPRVIDPGSGWVQNCNETPWCFTSPVLDEADWPAHIAPSTDQLIDLRVTASHTWLKAHETITPDDLLGLKFGKRALLADIALDGLLAAAADVPDLAPACDVLRTWDRFTHADSAGYPLFWLWTLLSAPQLISGSFFTPVEEPATVPSGVLDPAAGVPLLQAAVLTLAALGIPLDATLGQISTSGTDDAGAPVPSDGGAQLVGALKCLELIPAATGPVMVLGDTWVSRVQFASDGPPTAESLLVYGNTTEPGAPASRSQWPLWAADQLRP